MKWLLLIFSVVKPFFSSSNEHQMANSIAEFKEMIKENAIKVVGVFAAASTLATLFAAGIVIIAVDVGAQYDQNAYIYFSSMIMMGISLSLLSLIIAFGAAKAFSNENTSPNIRQVLESKSTSHPLQEALALLVHDFIKERELKRIQEEKEYFESERTQRSAVHEKFRPSPNESTHH